MPPIPPNVTTSGSVAAAVTSGSAVLSAEDHEYYVMRWRVCMTELRFLAGRLGWNDRLPPKGVS